MTAPHVSFAIPAYNRPALLAQALAGIAGQELNVDFEVLVCDDGDQPEAARLAAEFPGGRGRYLPNRPALGAVGNWNRCIGEARGEWVTVLHEDDSLFPWWLSLVHPRVRPGIAAIATQTTQGSAPPARARPRVPAAVWAYPPRYFLKSSPTPFPGVLIRRKLALQLGGFDERWGPLADYEFWYRLAQAGSFEVVRAVGAFYRVSSDQWTARTWERMLRLTHLLRLRIAREQFGRQPELGVWLARFFTSRNAAAYARRFPAGSASLARALKLRQIPGSWLPSGWVWQAMKLFA